jgi:quercetin dioxygenase-like cupin family protein
VIAAQYTDRQALTGNTTPGRRKTGIPIKGGIIMLRLLSMAALLATVAPLAIAKAVPAGGIQVSPEKTRPATPGPDTTFTGEVSVKPLFDANELRTFGAAEVSFTPCSRTAWHTHPGGQTLIVTSGTGWVQEWGGDKQRINPGDIVWTEPGVKHWHGAAKDAEMTHIAVQATVDGRPVDWMEHVTDEQYRA